MKQLTLGELITQLESQDLYFGEEKSEKRMRFDFATAIPDGVDSWRGDYSQLAIGYVLTGYDVSGTENHHKKITAKEFIEILKNAVGKTFTGWKGGNFVMNEETPVWVDNPGNYSETAVVGVGDSGFEIVLKTAFMEYED